MPHKYAAEQDKCRALFDSGTTRSYEWRKTHLKAILALLNDAAALASLNDAVVLGLGKSPSGVCVCVGGGGSGC